MQDPVLHGKVGGELERQHVVGGVSCGGEDSATCARLVQGADIGSRVLDVLLLGYKEIGDQEWQEQKITTL